MTTILTIAGVWIGASFLFGPIIGGALKSLVAEADRIKGAA